MSKPNFAKCTEEELWKYVASHLKKRGIDSVLVGGAVVSIYTDGLYKSGDLDLVTYEDSIKQLNEVFLEIDFVKKGMSFRHPDCNHLYVQVVKGPLGIGDDHKIKPAKIDVNGQTIKIFSPTDCIRDRLAAYIYDRSRTCFDQAILVANRHKFNSSKIKEWLKAEGQESVYNEFSGSLQKD